MNQPRFLCFFILSYTMALAFANWFDPRLVRLFTLVTDAGTLIFPLTYILSDIITEVYGYKYARKAIWLGFLFNLIFLLYGQMVIHLPSPNYPTNNYMFTAIMAVDARIILASFMSYLIAEPLNSLIMAKLKIKMHGKLMAVRFVGSTFIASGIDSIIFGMIAFYGVIANYNLFILVFTMWFIKVSVEIICLPLSVLLAIKIKQKEKIDVYDFQTNFNIFALESCYRAKDNLYR